MIRYPKMLALGLAVAIGGTSAVIAQDTPTADASAHTMMRHKANNLTPEQREQLRQLRQEEHARVQTRLAQILTPEQMADWQARKAQHGDHMHGKHHDGQDKHHQRPTPMTPPANDTPDEPAQ